MENPRRLRPLQHRGSSRPGAGRPPLGPEAKGTSRKNIDPSRNAKQPNHLRKKSHVGEWRRTGAKSAIKTAHFAAEEELMASRISVAQIFTNAGFRSWW